MYLGTGASRGNGTPRWSLLVLVSATCLPYHTLRLSLSQDHSWMQSCLLASSLFTLTESQKGLNTNANFGLQRHRKPLREATSGLLLSDAEPALGCKQDAELTPRCNHVYSCFIPRVQGTVCESCCKTASRQRCTTSTAPPPGNRLTSTQRFLGLQQIAADMTEEYSRVGLGLQSRGTVPTGGPP